MKIRNILTFCSLWVISLGYEQDVELPKPDIYSLRVESMITNRYAQTKVTSNVANRANASQEVFFTMTLPQNAFITSFLMEIEGKEYKAFLKEKEKAREEYEAAVDRGITAAHIEQNIRDSNIFTISVNVESQGRVKFILRCEELLSRALGMYTHVINLNPRQVVEDLQVDVYIAEPSKITKLFVPALRTSNEILEEEKENDVVKTNKTDNRVHVQYKPTLAEQEKLSDHEYGGQLVVQYDVDREGDAGNQILFNDGYFVHFFAPKDLQPMRQYVIFVLDLSYSMDGRKLEQLKEAMTIILEDLKQNDYFTIVGFDSYVTAYNLAVPAHSAVLAPKEEIEYHDLWSGNPEKGTYPRPDPYPATKENLDKAKQIINQMKTGPGTNINAALEQSIALAKTGIDGIKTRDNITDETKRIQPIIMFLTDGEPTVGITSPKKIISMVEELNRPKTPIYSLGFGSGADMSFLRKISLSSSAFARTIYEAADGSNQLKNFYKEISTLLLSNVTFNYDPRKVPRESLTKKSCFTYFRGSEIIVAGKVNSADFYPNVNALSSTGMQNFAKSTKRYLLNYDDDNTTSTLTSKETGKTQTTLERVWVYLTIKQLLDQRDAVEPNDYNTGKKDIEKTIVELAMKYQFVTPLTSLIVVKPNETKEAILASTHQEPDYKGFHPISIAGGPALSPRVSGSGSPYLSSKGFADPSNSRFTPRIAKPYPRMEVQIPDDDYDSMKSKLLSFDDIIWFNSSYSEETNTLSLPTGANGTNQHYSVAQQWDETPFQICQPGAVGIEALCHHLIVCITEDIATSLDKYMRMFCPLVGGFAGVCCF